jgi:hypothetical protein
MFEKLFDKAGEITPGFEIEASRPRAVGRQRNRANYPVDNSSDYWIISLCLVLFDHLVAEISKRVVSNEEYLASYLETLQIF